jgi:hypothetical protein
MATVRSVSERDREQTGGQVVAGLHLGKTHVITQADE